MGTLLLFGFVDPHFSFVSDRVVSGHATEPYFRRCVTGMAASRVLGTVLAQVVLMPGAIAIAWVATDPAMNSVAHRGVRFQCSSARIRP
ncbi:DUF2837 family protein [Candidatus Bathyarchaeota archaeon]|nr:DUF2837 family protein [Candidatus Bathyarchaeota archaeon]